MINSIIILCLAILILATSIVFYFVTNKLNKELNAQKKCIRQIQDELISIYDSNNDMVSMQNTMDVHFNDEFNEIEKELNKLKHHKHEYTFDNGVLYIQKPI